MLNSVSTSKNSVRLQFKWALLTQKLYWSMAKATLQSTFETHGHQTKKLTLFPTIYRTPVLQIPPKSTEWVEPEPLNHRTTIPFIPNPRGLKEKTLPGDRQPPKPEKWNSNHRRPLTCKNFPARFVQCWVISCPELIKLNEYNNRSEYRSSFFVESFVHNQ